MNKLKLIIITESLIILLLSFFIGFSRFNTREIDIIRFEEVSPNQIHKVIVHQKSEPTFPFGPVRFKVTLEEKINNPDTIEETSFVETKTFLVDVYDDGKDGDFETEWNDNYFKITFLGDEQLPNTLILPFNEALH